MKERLAGGLALALALLVVGLVGKERLAPPAKTDPHPPLDAEAAEAWLRTQAASHEADRWALLERTPAIARWYRSALSPTRLPLDALVAVSVARWPSVVRSGAASAAGVTPQEAVLLLDPPWADVAAAAACTEPNTAALPVLCGADRRDAEAAVDAWVAKQIRAGGPTNTTLLDALPELGTRGARAAREVLASGDDAAQARALLALSWADPAGAPPTLVTALQAGPLARLVAAVELGRLGHTAADGALADLQTALSGTGDAVLVAYARRLAARDLSPAAPGEGL